MNNLFPSRLGAMALATAMSFGIAPQAQAGILWEHHLNLGTITIPTEQPVGAIIYDSGLIDPRGPNSAGMGGCNDGGFGPHGMCRAVSDYLGAPLLPLGTGWYRTSVPGVAMQVMTYFPQYDVLKYAPYPQQEIFYPSGQAGPGVKPLFQIRLRTYGDGIVDPVDLPRGTVVHVYSTKPEDGWRIILDGGRIEREFVPL